MTRNREPNRTRGILITTTIKSYILLENTKQNTTHHKLVITISIELFIFVTTTTTRIITRKSKTPTPKDERTILQYTLDLTNETNKYHHIVLLQLL